MNKEEFIKSETIFTYVDNLEKENKKQKEVLVKIKEYMSLNMRVKLNEEFGETIQYKSIYSLLEEIE